MAAQLSLTMQLVPGSLSGNLLFTNEEENASINIWRRGSSWGDVTLSFVLETDDGPVSVTLRPQIYTVNAPFVNPIGAGQVFKLPFDLNDGQWINGGPWSPEVSELTAIYEVLETPESLQYNVWTGLLTVSHQF